MSSKHWLGGRLALSLICLWVTLTTTLTVGHAWAQQPAAAGSQDGLARARALYKEGTALFSKGDFEGAVEKFEAAYAFDPNPVLLFNLARATEEAGDYKRAIQWYEAYLARYKDDKDADAVRHRVHLLRQTVARNKQGKLTIKDLPEGAALRFNGVPAPAPSPEGHWTLAPGDYTLEVVSGDGEITWASTVKLQPGETTHAQYVPPAIVEPDAGWWQTGKGATGLGLAGLGAAALIGALVAEGQQSGAQSDYDDLSAKVRGGDVSPDTLASLSTARDDVDSLNGLSNVLWGVGGACLAAGTGLILWSAAEGPDTSAPTTTLKATPAGIIFSGRF